MHGFPLRAVVPGYIGARSVKWLSYINLQQAPSENYFQSKAYRLFPPEVDADNVVWEQGVALSDMPLNSVIWSPETDARLPSGPIQVSGWACANRGRSVERVESELGRRRAAGTGSSYPPHRDPGAGPSGRPS